MFSERELRQKRVSKDTILADGNGLYVRFTPRGRCSFLFRSQVGGKSRWKVLGTYPAMSLLEARNQAARAAQAGVLTFTVRQAYKEFLPHLKRSYTSWNDIQHRLEKDVLPELGDRPLDQVTKKDCADALQKIVGRGSLVAANRTLGDLKQFLAYCADRGWIQASPAATIRRKSVGGRERHRERALGFPELEQLFQVHQFTAETRLALALILFTGQRPSEVLGYDEAERAGTWWTVPAERTKPKRAQKVYLSPQARHLFKLAVQLGGRRPFKSDHRTLSQAVKRLGWKPPFTPHDLRRTMATRLADLGVAPHVVEKMLNHRMVGVMAIYNQAEYLPERRAAWRLWGAKLAQLRRRHEAVNPHHRLPGALYPSPADRRADRAPGSVHPGRGGVPLLDQAS